MWLKDGWSPLNQKLSDLDLRPGYSGDALKTKLMDRQVILQMEGVRIFFSSDIKHEPEDTMTEKIEEALEIKTPS